MLNVSVNDHGVTPGSKEAFCLVNITVLDTNDNPPVFVMSETTYTVSENQLAGTQVAQITAEDKDARLNGRIQYYITEGKHSREGHIESHSVNGRS